MKNKFELELEPEVSRKGIFHVWMMTGNPTVEVKGHTYDLRLAQTLQIKRDNVTISIEISDIITKAVEMIEKEIGAKDEK